MAIEADVTAFISDQLEISAYYQHGVDPVGDDFVWISRASDEYLDEMCPDPTELPDIVTFDVEIYGATSQRCIDLSATLRICSMFRGVLAPGTATVSLLEVQSQAEDYEPAMEAENLPPFVGLFQVAVHGYVP